jgi:hypothetical protein
VLTRNSSRLAIATVIAAVIAGVITMVTRGGRPVRVRTLPQRGQARPVRGVGCGGSVAGVDFPAHTGFVVGERNGHARARTAPGICRKRTEARRGKAISASKEVPASRREIRSHRAPVPNVVRVSAERDPIVALRKAHRRFAAVAGERARDRCGPNASADPSRFHPLFA